MTGGGRFEYIQGAFTKEKTEVTVKEGTTVLEAERIAGLSPDAPCGGAGKCGKCMVK